jgi:cysteine desulfurase|uniref:Cysteine desulfurase IscS n=1 Tax=candidate division WOR-3 bacterium TaxID=2052148 RepID=A0A7V3VV12_UNCW3
MKPNHRIYLDYAATTPLHPDVLEAMKPYFFEKFGNPSSIHSMGQEAREAIENSRKIIADALGASPEEIVFTSGGSESDNMAIKGVAYAMADKGKHIITTKIEHHAVLEPFMFLKSLGYETTFLPVDKYGMVDPDDVKKAITPKTILVSIMHANNEIGTIEPIEEISKICRERNVYLHTDAVQSFGAIDTNVNKLGVDLLSISAHKFYGPKGAGALYIRKGTRIEPLLHGGAQEMGKRASTHNVPGIVGMAKAVELAMKEMKERAEHAKRLRDRLIESFLKRVDDIILNGHPQKRLPNNCHFIVRYIEGEALLMALDQKGIEVATGSACSSGSLEPSHVLTAIGIPVVDARGSIRITLGRLTTDEDIDYVIEVFPKVVKELRSISPIARK